MGAAYQPSPYFIIYIIAPESCNPSPSISPISLIGPIGLIGLIGPISLIGPIKKTVTFRDCS